MELWLGILGFALNPITAFASWLVGRKKSNNDFLHDMQKSIDMLVKKNNEQLAELVELRNTNARLLENQEKMQIKIDKLTRENEGFRKEIEELNEKLKNVKTITRTKS
jgi:peptidoglycan hydrolase CwlO-like protein